MPETLAKRIQAWKEKEFGKESKISFATVLRVLIEVGLKAKEGENEG